ncbi:hypothetical protein LTR10_020696 [Elasticomyces elasticus]|uniref:Sister chromatid cohesion protein Dcc1 n=1 Tax=Exophiala sideris TaxID=1016849 RepID=A0ABR0JHU1_9EURO|nr:hypothetical protein LTR10_020696 [Elasticomyces elasticus]KAK5033557.1 hypothetical protein LTS07_003862 [Exophiala sideris]KAK5041948.1 hypothetical protein LTR13_001753 [Exophiala sideris]KAK5064101.1 hypothetical protein LTR69_003870 [Exophiala sideris]KAK5185216.1 hypothetical protein LTR44_002204 [Eurotiomycetes sp. CCFEE 6388]
MSTQHSGFPPVPFSATYPQESFRLLELPPELVSLIESQDKKTTRLTFKSAPASSSKRPSIAKNGYHEDAGQGYLHLCSDQKVWAVKQVSTSNSVYVTQTDRPRVKRRRIDDESQTNGGSPMSVDADEGGKNDIEDRAGITTISQVRNILELIEVKTTESDVEERIRDIVPLYTDDDDDEEMGSDGSRGVRLRDLMDDISAPTNAILDAATSMFVFSISRSLKDGDVRSCYIPTSSLLLRAWKAFFQQCAITGVKTDSDDFNVATLRNVLDDLMASENDGTHENGGKGSESVVVAVAKAILRRFAESSTSTPASGDVDDSETNQVLDTVPTVTSWKETEASEQIGKWLLKSLQRESKSQSSAKQVQLDDFQRQWMEILPDSWAAKSCDVTALVKSVDDVTMARDEQGNEVLRFAPPGSFDDILGLGNGVGFGRAPIKSAVAKATPASNAVDAAKNEKKRKWHEKFGAQRAVAAVKR